MPVPFIRHTLAGVLSALLLAAPVGDPLSAQSRRVVDLVKAGDEKGERDHDYAGDGVASGTAGDRAFRQATGWLRYTLTTYDDTAVTVVCLCRGTGRRR